MRTLIAIVLTAGLSLGAVGCFSKPGYTAGDGDGGVDAPGDVPVDPVCTPGDVPALTPTALSFAKLSAGPYHACGIDTQGQMWCWGYNGEEALGRPAMQPSPESGVALQVGTEAGWTDVAVGDDHSCGVQAGVAKCWGRNAEGQVNPSGSSLPKGVTAMALAVTPIASVYAGPRSTCARSTAGDAYCWGQVDYPDTGTAAEVLPTKLTVGANTWLDIAIATDHACAVSAAKDVYCWGRNDRLQLGVAGGTQPFSTPVQKAGTGYTQIAADELATCAIRGGTLVCWGARDHGQLGDPTTLPADNLEVVVDARTTWTQVDLGLLHACARDDGGQVTCYGDGYEGALGRGNDSTAWDLTTPTALANVTQVTAGRSFSCAVVTGGAAYCWGSNRTGQAGTGLVSRKLDASRARLPVGSCEKVQSIKTGAAHTCALVAGDGMPGHAYCWGAGDERQVDGTTELVTENPVLFTRSDGGEALFTQIAAGADHTCGLDPAGVIQCWGSDDAGELGNPTSTNPGRSVVASPDGAWTYVAAGATTTCAITTGGSLYCWGSIPGESFTSEGPLAVGPAPVTGWVWESLEIGSNASGGRSVIGVMRDGAGAPHLVGFGDNCSIGSPGGALMSTGTTPSSAPVELLGGTSFDTAVVAAAAEAGGHACVLTGVGGVGTLRCWGPNELGQATATTSPGCALPTVMPGPWLPPVAGAASVTAGAGHTVAITSTGAVACWGENYGTQCGRRSDAPTTPEVFSGAGARYAEVSTSRAHTCAIDDTRGAVWCWGRNDYGQLGDGARDYFAPHPAGITFP